MKFNKTLLKLLTFWIPVKECRRRVRKKIASYFPESKLKNFLYLNNCYKKTLKRIQQKILNSEKINVCFIGYQDGASCDVFTSLYNLFNTDKIFNVSVICLPFNHDSEIDMLEHQHVAMEYLKTLKIPAIPGYDEKTHTFINHHDKYDIVFYEVDYDWIRPEFSVSNFPNALNFFIPYGQFLADNIDYHFSQKMMSEFYCIYPPAKNIMNMMKKYSYVEGINVNSEFLGNPKTQSFFDRNYSPKDVWKSQQSCLKKIIWAPHHLWANYSNFLEYKDFFVKLAQKYRDKIQIAFKPHPALKGSLREKAGWSDEQIFNYYNLWDKMPNTQLETGGWTDLFLTSDAMIMDSIGFMLEYSLTGKPACVQYKEDRQKQRIMKFSECGEQLFNLLYHSKNETEIISFIENVVLNDNDIKKSKRQKYIIENYLPPYENTASQNIYNDVKRKIGL